MKWLKIAKQMTPPQNLIVTGSDSLEIDWEAVNKDAGTASKLSVEHPSIGKIPPGAITASEASLSDIYAGSIAAGKLAVGPDLAESQMNEWWVKNAEIIMGDIAASLPIYAAKNHDDKIKSVAKLLKEVGIYFKNLKANYENDAFVTVDAEMCFNDASTITKFLDALHGNP